MASNQNREYRSFAEIRASGQEYKLDGYASTFDPYVMAVDDKGNEYKEQISPNAFDECDMSDVVYRVDHMGMVYARSTAGTVKVDVDDHGLHTDIDLSRTANSRAHYEDVQAGNYPQMSFCFTVPEGGDHYDKESRTRVIDKIAKLYDVSAVSFPANPGTELHARDYFNGVIEAEKAERLESERKDKARKTLALRIKMMQEG